MVTLVFLLTDAFRPLRHAFPDDCDMVVGRGGDARQVTVAGDGRRFEVRAPAASLSDSGLALDDGCERDLGLFSRLSSSLAPAT